MWQEKKGSVEGRILWHLPDSHPDTQAMYNLLFGVYRTWIYDGYHSLKYRKGKRFLQMQLRLQNSKWVKRLSWMDQTYQMKTLKRMTGLGPSWKGGLSFQLALKKQNAMSSKGARKWILPTTRWDWNKTPSFRWLCSPYRHLVKPRKVDPDQRSLNSWPMETEILNLCCC